MPEFSVSIGIYHIGGTIYNFSPIILLAVPITGDEPIDCSADTTETYNWVFSDGPTYNTELVSRSFLPCLDYSITLTVNLGGFIHSVTSSLNLSREVVLDFEITNNYGYAPLTFHVEDTTDYSCTGFTPIKRTWYIIHFGCYMVHYGAGVSRNMTVSSPGIYGLRMTVSDGVNSYSITKREIIFALDLEYTDTAQIEFAHESAVDNRRHIIKSTNSFTDPEKNSIQFYMWGTELQEDDIATNEVAELRGEDLFITKNLHPLEDLIYNIGSETNRWNELVGKEADIKDFTQAKTLRLWGGQ